MKRDLHRQLYSLYSGCSLKAKLFVRGRLWIAPFMQIVRYVPEGGSVLDLGCGYGLFSNLLALDSSSRYVYGTDISESKLTEAQKTICGRKNISFTQGDVTENPLTSNQYSAITLIDLLHHISYSKQKILLSWAYDALLREGKLIIKDVDTVPRWKLFCSYAHDIIINHAWGQLYFVGVPELEGLIKETGFTIENKIFIKNSPYAHVLLVCRK